MQNTLLHLGISLALIAVVLVACRARGLSPVPALALRPPPWALFAGFVAGYVILGILEEVGSRRLGLGGITPWSLPPFSIALRVLGIVVLAPVSEELMFRGLLYDRLSDDGTRVARAIVVPALLFSAAHYSPGEHGAALAFTLAQPLIDGLYLGLVRYRTNSTIATILLHALGNLFAAAQRLGFLAG